MDHMINGFLDLFRRVPGVIGRELRGLQNTLYYLLAIFYGLCYLQWQYQGEWWINLVAFIMWLGAIPALFRIRRLARITLIGEVPEAVGATPAVPGAGINQTNVLYLRAAKQIFYVISIALFLIPMLPIQNYPWIIPTFTVAATILTIAMWDPKSTALETVSKYFFWMLLIHAFFLMFFPGWRVTYNDWTGRLAAITNWNASQFVVQSDAAKQINALDAGELSRKRQAAQNDFDRIYRDVIDPTTGLAKRKLTDEEKAFVSSYRNSELKTFDEVKKELSGQKESADELVSSLTYEKMDVTPMNQFLTKGTYYLKPVDGSQSFVRFKGDKGVATPGTPVHTYSSGQHFDVPSAQYIDVRNQSKNVAVYKVK